MNDGIAVTVHQTHRIPRRAKTKRGSPPGRRSCEPRSSRRVGDGAGHSGHCGRIMPSVPMTIRVFLGLAVLVATHADSCLRGAAQGIAPVQQPSDSPPVPGLAPVDGFQPFTSADALAAYNRANGLAHKGDYAAARRQVDEAIELEPSNRSSLLARCTAYRDLHDYGHAMDDCEEAIRLAPSDAQAHRERGRHAPIEGRP
jgi:hypothetical protein